MNSKIVECTKLFDNKKPSRAEAEEAIRVLIRYLGDNPRRRDLLDTPARVVKSYDEIFAGYNLEVSKILDKTFHVEGNYSGMITLTDIDFTSICEHHMLPFWGKVDIAYIPNDSSVVGVSKLARLVNIFANRMQVQEKMTMQIAEALQKHLAPKGVAVRVSAMHSCMIMRGIKKHGSLMKTEHFTGEFLHSKDLRLEFLQNIK
jgi:GTP cyclohydrolase I